jgi:hypothetical protein
MGHEENQGYREVGQQKTNLPGAALIERQAGDQAADIANKVN